MKYIIHWDAGYGEDVEIVEADSQEEAQEMAYEAWRETAEGNAVYYANEWTEELAEELGL